MLSDLTDWVIDVIDALGYLGVALLVALENVFPPIPSEIVLPLAGFVAGRGDANFFGMVLAATVPIGLSMTALALFTGAVWGKPTWGTYWQWDPRLTSTTVLFVMYLGYLVVRRLDLDREVRSRRAAIVGIVSFFNVVIVRVGCSSFCKKLSERPCLMRCSCTTRDENVAPVKARNHVPQHLKRFWINPVGVVNNNDAAFIGFASAA